MNGRQRQKLQTYEAARSYAQSKDISATHFSAWYFKDTLRAGGASKQSEELLCLGPQSMAAFQIFCPKSIFDKFSILGTKE